MTARMPPWWGVANCLVEQAHDLGHTPSTTSARKLDAHPVAAGHGPRTRTDR